MPRKATTGSYFPHPSPKYKDVIRLVQGRRKSSPQHWEGMLKINGVWTQPISLKTDDIEHARDRSIEIYINRQAGRHVVSRHTVKAAAILTTKRLSEARADALARHGNTKVAKFDIKLNIIKRVILPEFGHLSVIAANDAEMLDKWLSRYRVKGRGNGPERVPAKSTIGNINGAWQEIMEDARQQNWLKKSHINIITQADHDKGERRPSISDNDMLLIKQYMSPE